MRIRTLLLSLLLASCSSSDDATMVLVTGGETDTFTETPVPTELVVESVAEDDGGTTATTLATVSLPATGNVSLSNIDTSTVAAFRVTGLDSTGAKRVFGETLPIDFSALDDVTFDVFVQRTEELARMPSPLSDSRPSPLVGLFNGRFIVVAGGTDPSVSTSSQLYDIANLSPVDTPPALPDSPLSFAFSGTAMLLLDATGAAGTGTWFDLTTSTSTAATAPSGGTFADVAGGQTFTSTDGSTSYVVGATRTSGDPTNAVLIIGPYTTNSDGSTTPGTLTFATLTAPRLGAAAVWVDGHGLVVTGGSAAAAGVEVLAPDTTSALPLPYPPDPSTGAGAAQLDASHVLLAGGTVGATSVDGGAPDGGAANDATLREIDLGCTTTSDGGAGCSYLPGWTAPLATTLSFAQAFDIDAATAFVVGEDATGATHAFRVTPSATTEIALKVPRSHARAVALPTPGFAIVGGAPQIESFVP